MELDGDMHTLHIQQGLEISPGAKHQARNDSRDAPVEFIVISHPTTRGDRVDLTLSC